MKQPIDPLVFQKKFWPQVNLYKEQKEIIYSVRDNIETLVPAGNALGKDFISAFIVLWFFCSRRPARVVTTSVGERQLRDVLWGEMNWFIQNSKYPLPIQVNHMHIRQIYNDGTFVPKCEIIGQVVQQGEGLLGRHLPKLEDGGPTTLVVFDEASAIGDITYESCLTWSHRRLIIGNCWETSNFFRKGVEEGDKILTT